MIEVLKDLREHNYFWMAVIASLLPAIFFLILDAGDWPNNWDDFQRLFNGIAPEHNLIQYGIRVSTIMMKLGVHDPVLTLSNRLRFQFPLLAILAEVLLLTSPVLVFSRLVYLRGEVLLSIAISMGYSGLTLIGTRFLPPAGYPLGFSLAFCLALFISMKLIYCFFHKSNLLTKIIVVFAIIVEQITFIFYATCYLQSLLITLLGIFIVIYFYRSWLTRKSCMISIATQIVRFSILPLLTVNWRLSHPAVSGESFSSSIQLNGLITALTKWTFGGTPIAAVLNMGNPRVKLIENMDLKHKIIFTTLIFLTLSICIFLWNYVMEKKSSKKSKIDNIFFEKLNPYLAIAIIGLCICVAWSLPAFSDRYYSEMQQDYSEIYAAMRYSSFGLILIVASLTSYLFRVIQKLINDRSGDFGIKLSPPNTSKLLGAFFLPLWLYTGFININILYEKSAYIPNGFSLQGICSQKSFTANDYVYWGSLVPSEVFGSGVDGWLPSLNLKKKSTEDSLEKFVGEVFIQNSRQLCGR
jgi:hypothetical protein